MLCRKHQLWASAGRCRPRPRRPRAPGRGRGRRGDQLGPERLELGVAAHPALPVAVEVVPVDLHAVLLRAFSYASARLEESGEVSRSTTAGVVRVREGVLQGDEPAVRAARDHAASAPAQPGARRRRRPTGRGSRAGRPRCARSRGRRRRAPGGGRRAARRSRRGSAIEPIPPPPWWAISSGASSSPKTSTSSSAPFTLSRSCALPLDHAQKIPWPPSTPMVWPVTQDDSSEVKNSTALAMSSAVPRRRRAMPATSAAWPSGP